MSLMKTYLHWCEENKELFQQLKREEEWREIKGCEGYEVSNFGRVRSYVNNRHGYKDTPHILAQAKPFGEEGYRSVSLGRDKTFLVHVLVAEAFLTKTDATHKVLHNNSVRHHNNVDNLRYDTQSENIKQGVREGSVKPEVARAAKLEKCVTYILHKGEETLVVKNLSEFARQQHISNSNIYCVVKGERNSCGGYSCKVSPLKHL